MGKPNIKKMVKEKDVDGLITALRDVDSSARFDVALSLGEIGDKRTVEPLIKALRDENEDVRDRAVLSLGKIKGAKKALKKILKQ